MPRRAERFKEIPSDVDISVVVGWRTNNGISGGTVELRNDAAKLMRKTLNRRLASLVSRRPRRFDYEGELEDDQYFVASSSVIGRDSILFEFLRSRASRVFIDAQDLPNRSLLFYAISVGSSVKRATIYFRKSNPYILMRAGSIFWLEGQSLVPFTHPVFKVDGRVDAILFEDETVVLNKLSFEQLFLDEGLIADAMESTVSSIVSSIGMSATHRKALGVFAVGNAAVRRRLRAIQARGILQRASISEIRAEIKRQGLRETDFIKGDKLILREGYELELVKLLNEDRYIGGISKLHYDVDRKSVAG